MWINSSTLAARSQAVERLSSQLNQDRLNADNYAELMVARLENRANLTVGLDQVKRLNSMDDSAIVEKISRRLLTGVENPSYRDIS